MLALTLAVSCLTAGIPPPAAGHYAKDTTGRISAETLLKLDTLGIRVNATGNGQLGVLVVKSTNGVPPHTFATQTFNEWGVGHREYDNGILLFVALDDRKAEIILGDGLTRISTGDTDAVMANQVVPNFKAGKPEQALVDAATALASLLTSGGARSGATAQTEVDEKPMADLFTTGRIADPSPRHWLIDLSGEVPDATRNADEKVSNELYASNARPLFIVVFRSRQFSAAQVRERAGASLRIAHPKAAVLAVNLERADAAFSLPPELRNDRLALGFEDQIANAALMGGGLGDVVEATQRAMPVLVNGLPQRSMQEVVDGAVRQHGWAMGGAGGVFGLFGLFWVRRWNRYRPRECETCHRPRQRLPAGAEDKHLSAGQQTEQAVGAIDYDVWWCGACRTVLVRNNSAWLSGYGRCDSCRNKTAKATTTTLTYATEWSGGVEQIDERCAHCNHHRSYTRATARLTRSDRSSSSFSSSSSSRSSGSSFGGGSSSGRGSSGSW